MSEYNIQMNKYNALNAGYDQLYPQPMKHANTHAKDGSDPITPASIGAYTKTETDTLLSSKPNPNLLDNPYFGNPVDQRGGYVYPPNSPYADRSGNQIDTTSKYLTIDKSKKSPFSDDWAEISIDGTTYYGYIQYAVRGYIGAGYGIDRWKQLYDSTYCLIQDGYVSFYGADFGQMIETKIIPLNTPLTYSVLTAEGILGSITFQFDGTQNQTTFGLIGETKFRANFIYNWGNTYTPFFLQTEGNVINVVAMKLELGTQQTLAHQENGVWVLNEIPNYWEELLKCIQSTADASDTFANKTVLHTGNAQSLGFPKIAIGSYVGTGTSDPFGGTKQNSLTFDFEPKMLAVVADGSNMFFPGFLIVRGQTYSDGIGSFMGGNAPFNLHITWSGNTVSWWSSNRIDIGTKYPQMNAENTTYRYVALG